MIETNFKSSPIGLIPKDWEIKCFGDISVNPGYGVSASAVPFNGVDKYIRITDIDDERGKFSPNPLSSPSFFTDKHFVQPKDILFARTGASVGKTYVYNPLDGRLIFAGFLMRLNISGANASFAFNYTQSYPFKKWVHSESTRSAQPGINIQQLKGAYIPLPSSPSEQERIAKALRDVDDLIDTTEKLLQKKRDIKQGAMQQLLSGKRRLPDFTKPWEEKPLIYFFDVLRGKGLSKSQISTRGIYPCILYGQLFTTYNEVIKDVQYFTNIDDGTLSLSGDILMPCSTTTCGEDLATSSTIPYDDVRIGGDIAILRNKREISSIFFSYIIPLYKADIVKCTHGVTIVHLQTRKLLYLKVNVPSDTQEQEAIAKVLSDMDAEIDELQRNLYKYIALREAMMQQLLTGKIRLV